MGKKVWIFNHYAGPPSVASGLRHYNFAKHMIRAGYPTTVFCSSAIHNTEKNIINDGAPYMVDVSEGVPFVYIKTRQYTDNGLSRVKNMLDYYQGLFRLRKNFEKPDIILASSVHPLACVAGIKIAKKLGVPCICEVRDLWPESIVAYQGVSRRHPVIWLLYKLEKWIYKKADKLIFTIEGGIDYIRDKGWDKQVDLTKIFHINNGIDLLQFDQNVSDFNYDDGVEAQFKFIYTGSIRKANNLGPLLEAVRLIEQRYGEHIRFIFYGRGDDVAALERYVAENGLRSVVFQGFVDKKYVPSILCGADAVLLHFGQHSILRYGSSFNKQFDYFAAGRPILQTVEVGYNLIIKHGCGMSVKQDAASIAQGLEALIKLPAEEKMRLGLAARALAAEYDFKRLTKELMDIIDILGVKE